MAGTPGGLSFQNEGEGYFNATLAAAGDGQYVQMQSGSGEGFVVVQDDTISLGTSTGDCQLFINNGSPVGVVTPNEAGDLCVDLSTPALWQATAGSDNTAWAEFGSSSFPAWFQTGTGNPNGSVVPNTVGGLYFDTAGATGFWVAFGSADNQWASLGGLSDIGGPGLNFFHSGVDPQYMGATLYAIGVGNTVLLVSGGGGGQIEVNDIYLQLTTGGRTTQLYVNDASPVGAITPQTVGDICIDTNTPALWQATGTANTDWQEIGGGGGGGLTLSLSYNAVGPFSVPIFSAPVGYSGGAATLGATLTTGSGLITGLLDANGNPIPDGWSFPALIFVESGEIFDIIALNAYVDEPGQQLAWWGQSGGQPSFYLPGTYLGVGLGSDGSGDWSLSAPTSKSVALVAGGLGTGAAVIVEDSTPPSIGLFTGTANTQVYINAGSPVGSLTPSAVGNLCVDTTLLALWQATGTGDTDWQLANSVELLHADAAPGATLTLPNPSQTPAEVITLSADLTISPWASPVEGQSMRVWIQQPATGGTYDYTVTWSGFVWPESTGGPTQSTVTGSTDQILVTYLYGDYFATTIGQAYG